MLAGDRAVELDGSAHDLVERGVGGRGGTWLGLAKDDGGVEIAVARVAEGADEDAMPIGDALDPLHHLR